MAEIAVSIGQQQETVIAVMYGGRQDQVEPGLRRRQRQDYGSRQPEDSAGQHHHRKDCAALAARLDQRIPCRMRHRGRQDEGQNCRLKRHQSIFRRR
jgi:hypothetical protein